MSGTLFLVATPIGNLGDITRRAEATLRQVGAIACEDTRRTLKLLSALEIERPSLFFACNDTNERKVLSRILGLLEAGTDVALCTDAGMPMVSDPGFFVSHHARAAGYRIEVIPGPSAVSTALIASGLPVHSWTFLGFPPRKSGARQRMFAAVAEADPTLVLFESPYRVGQLLDDAHAVLGPREAAVCTELTKLHEAVDRGTLDELSERYRGKTVKGEVTIVIAGKDARLPEPLNAETPRR